jgi:hypothetical protein
MASIDRATLRAAIVALGLASAGLLIGNGFARGRAADRFVTVKGVAEKEVRADLAIWPIRIVGADNELSAANSKLANSVTGVRRFLVRHGVDTSQVQLTEFSVSDAFAAQFGSDRNKLKPDMIADATARAREAAVQFARDSHSQLGGIRQANQGVFEILPRDQAQGITQESQIDKIVGSYPRLTTT